MSVISEVKDAVVDAKKKYDKEKYIYVLEENLKVYEEEIKRTNGQLSNYIDRNFIITKDHLELFNIYRNDSAYFTLEYLTSYTKKSVDLEIALSELLNNGYFKRPNIIAVGMQMRLSIPDDKKIELLLALKREQSED